MSTAQESYEAIAASSEKKPSNPMESAELDKLFEALAKAQMEMEIARTESSNPYFKSKYADLRSIVEASRPFLSKNGLCVLQRTINGADGRVYLHTRLGHASGQWMESLIPVNPPKQDIQSLGSYMTYLRRYSYSSIVGVVTGEEDDDGEKAMENERKVASRISAQQLTALSRALEGEEGILNQILSSYKIDKLADVPVSRFSSCMENIEKIKRSREERRA